MSLLWLILVYIFLVQIFVYKRGILDCHIESGKSKIFMFLTLGVLLLLNCLRSIETGNDTMSYYLLFEHYKGQSGNYSSAALQWMNSYIDVGYRFINYLFLKISNNYQLFISCIAIFMYCIVGKYIKKYSPNVVYSVYLFFLMFFHMYLNILRQALAITIIIANVHFLFEKKTIRFMLAICIAMLFHKTAIIALLLIPMAYKKHFSFKKSCGVIVLASILTYSGTINRLLGILGYTGKYLGEEIGASTLAGIFLSLIVLLCMLFLNRKVNNKEEVLDGGNDIFARFYIRVPIIQVIISIASLALPIMYRFEYYFTIFYIVGIPYFLTNNSDLKSNKKIVGLFLIIVYIVYISGILIFRPEWYSEFQYKFFWN